MSFFQSETKTFPLDPPKAQLSIFHPAEVTPWSVTYLPPMTRSFMVVVQEDYHSVTMELSLSAVLDLLCRMR